MKVIGDEPANTDYDPNLGPSAVGGPIEVKPFVDVPFPAIDLGKTDNPIPAIMATREFTQTCDFFASNPAAERSLVSAMSQALIYALIRNLRPQHVVEIGTFRGGTTEAMSRAVVANRAGAVHTVGPFDRDLFAPVFAHWPADLRKPVSFYPIDSMAFFMELERRGVRPDLVFVDGNHDFEFASFDIQCSARRLTAGGFIIVDNVAQAGPYFAVKEFLERNPHWVDCGCTPGIPDRTKAFDRGRSNIPGTDFMVVRAPTSYLLGARPRSFGEIVWNQPRVSGLRIACIDPQKSGTLHVQCVLRGFTDSPVAEVVAEASRKIGAGTSNLDVKFENPPIVQPDCIRYSVEPWLIWIGDDPLHLRAVPIPI